AMAWRSGPTRGVTGASFSPPGLVRIRTWRRPSTRRAAAGTPYNEPEDDAHERERHLAGRPGSRRYRGGVSVAVPEAQALEARETSMPVDTDDARRHGAER